MLPKEKRKKGNNKIREIIILQVLVTSTIFDFNNNNNNKISDTFCTVFLVNDKCKMYTLYIMEACI